MIRNVKRSDFKSIVTLSASLFGQHNDPDFPLSETHLYAAMNAFMASPKSYFKIMLKEGELVAWMLATEGHSNHHSDITAMSQIYYHSNLKGLAAAHALLEFHKDFFHHVERKGYQIAVTSSVLPNAEVFTRVLKLGGWDAVSGARLTKKTKFHPGRRQAGRGAHSSTSATPPRAG